MSGGQSPPGAPSRVRAEPLQHKDFAPFGHVIDVAALPAVRVNEDRGQRQDLPALSRTGILPATTCSAIYTIEPSRLPFRIRTLERHRLSDQLFLALNDVPFLVAVAPAAPDGRPNVRELRAFVGTPGQVVIYKAGMWHAPLVALDRHGSYLMQMWQTGTREDCELVSLNEDVVVLA